jgi:hypothetical protein
LGCKTRREEEYEKYAYDSVREKLAVSVHRMYIEEAQSKIDLHNKPELPFLAKLVCTTLFGPKMEIQPLLQSFNQR